MATILNDKELRKLFKSVILNGEDTSIRPNSYILRLGSVGEFLNVGKEFTLGKKKKGLKIPPGHSVALTAHEEIDFRRETVRTIYPDHDLHAFISPTTDLSREGLVAPTTQVDAGYHGTLNWTVTNTSNEERRFVYNERMFRLTILKLEPGETPIKPYEGDYQNKMGYVRSRRKGAPMGMREDEWEDPAVKGSPEALLENLMKSGYPWHALGQKLKMIDQEMKIVTDEYAEIHDSMTKINNELNALAQQQQQVYSNLQNTIRSVLHDEAPALQNRWIVATASMFIMTIGLILSFASSESASNFIKAHGGWLGLIMVICGIGVVTLVSRRKKKD